MRIEYLGKEDRTGHWFRCIRVSLGLGLPGPVTVIAVNAAYLSCCWFKTEPKEEPMSVSDVSFIYYILNERSNNDWNSRSKILWVLKNWCFWIVVLEKILESFLDCKEIKPVHPKGNQHWIFTGRTDAEAETPILWPPDAKSRLTGKDPDAEQGKRRRGWQTMQWLECITNAMDMSLSKLWETVKEREVGRAAVHRMAKSWTWLSDWTRSKILVKYIKAQGFFTSLTRCICNKRPWQCAIHMSPQHRAKQPFLHPKRNTQAQLTTEEVNLTSNLYKSFLAKG